MRFKWALAVAIWACCLWLGALVYAAAQKPIERQVTAQELGIYAPKEYQLKAMAASATVLTISRDYREIRITQHAARDARLCIEDASGTPYCDTVDGWLDRHGRVSK